jgi:hypothetical protein
MARTEVHRAAGRGLGAPAWLDVAVIAGSILGCLFLFEDPGFLGLATNADYLQLAFNVWDYSLHDYARQGFEMSRVPSIVPDLVFYAPVQLASGSWRLASLSYAVFSLLALAAAAGSIAHQITRCGWLAAAKLFLLLTLGLLALELPMTPASQHVDFFVVNNHGGPFILALAGLSVAWSWLDRPTRGKLGWLFVIVVAGVLSDLLFLVACVGPFCAVLAYGMIRRRLTIRSAAPALGTLLAGIAAARLLDLLLVREDVPFFRMLSAGENAGAFRSSLGTLIGAAPPSVLLAYGLGLAALLLGCIFRARGEEGRARAIGAVEFWWIASIGSVLATVLVIASVYEDLPSYRYTMPLRWWPVIWTAALLARGLGSGSSAVATTGLSGMAAWLGYAYLSPGLHVPALLAWHHPLEACVTTGQRSAGLKAGLADYWLSRSLAASSNWQLQIDQIEPDGSGQYYGNDPFWYTHDVHDGARPPDYNYIIMTRLDEASIAAHYGRPDRTLNCGGSAVWIYDNGAAMRQALLQGSPSLYTTFLESGEGIDQICVPADRFYSHLHDAWGRLAPLSGPLEVRADSPGDEEPVIWGPYLDLPRGRWEVSLAYRLQSDAPGQDRWEVSVMGLGHTTVFEGVLNPTEGATRVLRAEIDLARREHDVEIRSRLAGVGTLDLVGARIARAGSGDPRPCGWR